MTRRIRRSERGSSLIIALAFLLVFSLWLTSTLTATESGLNVAQTMRVQPKRLYAAEAAIEKAIQDMRYDGAEASGGRWNDPDCSSQYTLQNPPQTVFVRCEPDDNSGRGDEGESSPPVGIIGLSNGAFNESAYQQYENSVIRIDGGVYSNTPLHMQTANNLQLNLCARNVKRVTATLVRLSPTVVSLEAPFTALDVGVPIMGTGIPIGTTISGFVNPTTVTMSRSATTSSGLAGRLITFREEYPKLPSHCHIPTEAEDPLGEDRRKGKLTAVPRPPDPESCNKDFIVAKEYNCDFLGASDPAVGFDPGYPVDKFSGFSVQSVPPCGDPSDPRPVEVQPGWYKDAVALSALTTGCDKLIWFKPGTYNFDFDDANPVWTIGNPNLPNLTVVGGAKTWVGNPFFGCAEFKNGKTTITAGGSVFNNATGYWVNAGYNLPYGTSLATAGGNSATFNGAPLTTNFTNCKPENGPIKQGIFTISPNTGSNPIGSLCDPATNEDHPGVQFVFGGESRMLVNDNKIETCSPVVGTRQQITIYGASSGKGQLTAQKGCILAQPYTPSSGSGCAMVKAPQGSKGAFIVHGTIYAPKAAIDLSLLGVGYQVVSRGIIARVIALSVSPSATFNKPIIYSPNFGSIPGAPRKMVLTACLNDHCPEDGGSGIPKIRALVRIKDDDENNNPGVPGFKVFIDSWSVL